MAYLVVIGANVLGYFITVSGLSQALVSWVAGLNLSALGLIILIMVAYAILGIPLSALTILLITMPILQPILVAYDINLLWFGILAITQVELANLTPPVGINLFVVAGMVKPQGIQMGTVFRGVIPFCITCVAFLVLMIAFPEISLFLVNLMK